MASVDSVFTPVSPRSSAGRNIGRPIILAIIVVIQIVVILWIWQSVTARSSLIGPTSIELASIVTPTTTSTISALPTASIQTIQPTRIAIASLNLDASIENVGLTAKGLIEIPKRKGSAGFFKLGAKAGELGSAVIIGHNTDDLYRKEVFGNLKSISVGSEIRVSDATTTFRYRVNSIATYNKKDFPIDKVFLKNDGRYLNLVTCDGAWLPFQNSYDKRLVVYSELLED